MPYKKFYAFAVALLMALPLWTVKLVFAEEIITIEAPMFASVVYPYSQPKEEVVKIGNYTSSFITLSSVTLTGQDASAFILGGSTSNVLSANAYNSARTVQPAAGLAPGTYTATFSITCSMGTFSQDISFTVNKAPAPNIVFPEASNIIYTQTLAESNLTGGSTEYGTFAWIDGEIIPTEGIQSYSVTFTPNADTLTYYDIEPMVREVSVTANKAALNGEVAVKGDAHAEQLLSADDSLLTSNPGIASLGELSYQWLRNGMAIDGATGATYTPGKADIGQAISVEISAANCNDVVISNVVVITKAQQQSPSAPTLNTKTADTIILNAVVGAEYKKIGGAWQTEGVFVGLMPDTSYTFYVRLVETDTRFASPESVGLTVTTNPVDTNTSGGALEPKPPIDETVDEGETDNDEAEENENEHEKDDTIEDKPDANEPGESDKEETDKNPTDNFNPEAEEGENAHKDDNDTVEDKSDANEADEPDKEETPVDIPEDVPSAEPIEAPKNPPRHFPDMLIVSAETFAAASRERGSVELEFSTGRIVFGAAAAETIALYADGTDLTVTLTPTEPLNGREVYNLIICGSKGETLTNFGGNVQVSLPYELNENENPNALVVYYIDANSNCIPVRSSRYENGQVVFTTTHFSEYSIGYNPVTFSDAQGHFAQDAIERAASRGLVSGYGGESFAPDANITRAEFVQMLSNVLVFPSLIPSSNAVSSGSAYTDVTPDNWFYPAVSAAQQAGLLNGLAPDETFHPSQAVTNADAALIVSDVAKLFDVREIPIELNRFVTRAQAVQIQAELLEALSELN